MPAIATIGVYGWTLDAWLAALRAAGIQVVVDVRQRRGVRGSEYAWANAQRLQAVLIDAGIAYEHRQELARSRVDLAPVYVERYEREILGPVDLRPIVEGFPAAGAALVCVERDPEACHRSLIADRLAAEFGFTVTHLRPA